jgi:hypothetical protein
MSHALEELVGQYDLVQRSLLFVYVEPEQGADQLIYRPCAPRASSNKTDVSIAKNAVLFPCPARAIVLPESPDPMHSWGRLDGVDVLRGLAILFVLLNHVNMRLLIADIPYGQSLPAQLLSSVHVISTFCALRALRRYYSSCSSS